LSRIYAPSITFQGAIMTSVQFGQGFAVQPVFQSLSQPPRFGSLPVNIKRAAVDLFTLNGLDEKTTGTSPSLAAEAIAMEHQQVRKIVQEHSEPYRQMFYDALSWRAEEACQMIGLNNYYPVEEWIYPDLVPENGRSNGEPVKASEIRKKVYSDLKRLIAEQDGGQAQPHDLQLNDEQLVRLLLLLKEAKKYQVPWTDERLSEWINKEVAPHSMPEVQTGIRDQLTALWVEYQDAFKALVDGLLGSLFLPASPA
jgi:hypothetical protein